MPKKKKPYWVPSPTIHFSLMNLAPGTHQFISSSGSHVSPSSLPRFRCLCSLLQIHILRCLFLSYSRGKAFGRWWSHWAESSWERLMLCKKAFTLPLTGACAWWARRPSSTKHRIVNLHALAVRALPLWLQGSNLGCQACTTPAFHCRTLSPAHKTKLYPGFPSFRSVRHQSLLIITYSKFGILT